MAKGKVVATNRKARHDYFVEDTYEAGIELVGTEVKSIRQGKSNLRDAYAQVKDAQLYVHNMHVSPYEKGNIFNKDPMRIRKLLMHKREIIKLGSLMTQKGYTLIPLSLYLKNGLVKIEIGLCKGKKQYDKRQDLKEKAIKRDMDKSIKIR